MSHHVPVQSINGSLNANSNSIFGDDQILDFSDDAFVAFSVQSTSEARGGNGNGGGGKKPPPPPDDPVPTEIYISGSDDGSGFNIEIHFEGDGWTTELKAAFIEAADFLSIVIAGDRPDYVAADDPNNFFNQDIDDIMITATLVNIDGAGGVLGRAGPTHVIYSPADGETSSDALPFAGIMEFDIADAQTYLDAGTWADIVFHEMMHTLGFGTMWESTGVVDLVIDDNGTRRPTDDTYTYDYTGEFAIGANDGIAPEVETDGGSGTAGGHWDEDTYGNELMTGYIDPVNDLWQMSIASLGDLGYEMNWLSDEYMNLG